MKLAVATSPAVTIVPVETMRAVTCSGTQAADPPIVGRFHCLPHLQAFLHYLPPGHLLYRPHRRHPPFHRATFTLGPTRLQETSDQGCRMQLSAAATCWGMLARAHTPAFVQPFACRLLRPYPTRPQILRRSRRCRQITLAARRYILQRLLRLWLARWSPSIKQISDSASPRFLASRLMRSP